MIYSRLPLKSITSTLKSLCKNLFCTFLWLGLPNLSHGAEIERDDSGGVILQYHHVNVSSPSSTSLSPQQFKAHLDYLKIRDFTVWPLTRLVCALAGNRHCSAKALTDSPYEVLPNRLASITFDDAYLDIFEQAYPLLKQYKLPFTIFVSTQFIGQVNYLSWDQLKEMQTHGATIANHTHSHTHMLRRLEGESKIAWLDRMQQEILRAEGLIESHLGEPAKLFAYPYGEYNGDILALVERLGYVGFGQQSGPAGFTDDARLYPRFPFSGIYAGMAGFKTKLATRPLAIESRFIEPVLSTGENRPNWLFKLKQDKLDAGQLNCYGPGGRTQIERLATGELNITASADLPTGRSRYNCTLPSKQPGEFYWRSQIWINKLPDGSWYPEP